jgi:hypothetical protein
MLSIIFKSEKLEIETIDYIVRYFTKGFEKEIKEFDEVIQNDFKNQKNRRNINITRDTLWNTANSKNYALIEKRNLKLNNNEKPEKFNESITDTHSFSTNKDSKPKSAFIAGRSD